VRTQRRAEPACPLKNGLYVGETQEKGISRKGGLDEAASSCNREKFIARSTDSHGENTERRDTGSNWGCLKKGTGATGEGETEYDGLNMGEGGESKPREAISLQGRP